MLQAWRTWKADALNNLALCETLTCPPPSSFCPDVHATVHHLVPIPTRALRTGEKMSLAKKYLQARCCFLRFPTRARRPATCAPADWTAALTTTRFSALACASANTLPATAAVIIKFRIWLNLGKPL